MECCLPKEQSILSYEIDRAGLGDAPVRKWCLSQESQYKFISLLSISPFKRTSRQMKDANNITFRRWKVLNFATFSNKFLPMYRRRLCNALQSLRSSSSCLTLLSPNMLPNSCSDFSLRASRELAFEQTNWNWLMITISVQLCTSS